MSKKIKIIIASVIAVVIVGGFAVVGYKNATNNKFIEDSMPVDLYTIPGKEKIIMNGKILPLKSEKFTIPAGYSEIDKMNVKDGQVIKKDTLLFSCKSKEKLDQIDSLNQSLNKKKKELNRTQEEEVKALLNSEISDLNSEIESLKKSAHKDVKAPFDGKVYIEEQKGEDGQTIQTVILETKDYYVKTQTNEMDIVKLKKDQEVEIRVTSTKESVKGKISFIGDRPIEGADTSSEYNGGGMNFANFDIKITPSAQIGLKNGFGVQVIAQYGKEEYKVPLSAIVEEDSKNYVFKIIDDIAVKTEVNIKQKTEEFAVIDSGIVEEDTIARDAMDSRVVDGYSIYEPIPEGVLNGEVTPEEDVAEEGNKSEEPATEEDLTGTETEINNEEAKTAN